MASIRSSGQLKRGWRNNAASQRSWVVWIVIDDVGLEPWVGIPALPKGCRGTGYSVRMCEAVHVHARCFFLTCYLQHNVEILVGQLAADALVGRGFYFTLRQCADRFCSVLFAKYEEVRCIGSRRHLFLLPCVSGIRRQRRSVARVEQATL